MLKDAQVASKQTALVNTVSHNNRRISKTLVELSIGIIGIIGIMLAQISSGNANSSHLSVTHQMTKAQDLTASPLALKIDWINILL